MTDIEPERESAEAAAPELNEPDRESLSPGQILRNARERHEMSSDDLATRTALNATIVEALESDRFEKLPQAVFVRGYYRKCAKVLDIDEKDLIDAYGRSGGEAKPQPVVADQVDVTPRDVTPRRWRALKWLVVIVLLLVVAAIVWSVLPAVQGGFDGKNAGSVNTTDAVGTVAPIAVERKLQGNGETAEPGPALPHSPESNPGGAAGPAALTDRDTAAGAPESITDAPPDNATTKQASAAAVNQSAPADSKPPVDSNKLVLTFDERSWVRVRDADGTTLLVGNMEAGSRRALAGNPPYSIVLGYAPGVDVTLGGQEVDLSGRIAANNTAELTLRTDNQ